MRRASSELESAAHLVERLRGHRDEIEAATLARVLALSDPPPAGGPEYAQGLRAAVGAAVEYGIGWIEGVEAPPTVPAALLAQARLAARSGVGLDTVLRRYLAGHTLLGDFLAREVERAQDLDLAELKRLLRLLAAGADRLLAAVSDAYAEESRRHRHGAERRRAELVERLLAGEPLDAADLGYELDCWHLGLLAFGREARPAIASLAHALDARLLVLHRDRDLV